MLKKVNRLKIRGGRGAHFAIIASKYNPRYVDGMLRGAESVLRDGGASTVQVFRVPGSYEIPVVAAQLAQSGKRPAAIICLGVVLRGETAHADLIVGAVTQALARIQVEYGVPVIHEVLLLDNEKQAAVRCLGKEHNRGAEAALTALEMAALMKTLPPRSARKRVSKLKS